MAIERERWSVSDLARHYPAVTDVLRDYLEAAEGIPARERDHAELRALPPHLSAGACGGLTPRCSTRPTW